VGGSPQPAAAPNGPVPPGPRRHPLGQWGLAGSWPCPLSSWTAGSVCRRLRHDYPRSRGCAGGRGPPGKVGSSPLPSAGGVGHTIPSPGSVPEPTPADHQRRRMMPRHPDRPPCRVVQWLLPVAPTHTLVHAGSTAMIHRPWLAAMPASRSRNRLVGCRRRCGGRPCRAGRGRGLPAGGAGLGEVEVLNRQRAATVGRGSSPTAARSRPSRVEAGCPSRSRVIVCGLPSGLPAG
jgi:hypothetical protein